MAQRLRTEVLVSSLELQTSEQLESLSDVSLRTQRALGLISLVDTDLVDDYGKNQLLNFDRVCERLDEINDWGELLIAQDMDGGRIVGALQATFNRSDNRYMIDYLAVNHLYRGRGVGKELVDVAERSALQQSLGSLSLMALQQSVGFYDQIGFELDPGRGRSGRTGSYIPMVRPVPVAI